MIMHMPNHKAAVPAAALQTSCQPTDIQEAGGSKKDSPTFEDKSDA
jgi:hypothetical protein